MLIVIDLGGDGEETTSGEPEGLTLQELDHLKRVAYEEWVRRAPQPQLIPVES